MQWFATWHSLHARHVAQVIAHCEIELWHYHPSIIPQLLQREIDGAVVAVSGRSALILIEIYMLYIKPTEHRR